MRIQKEKEKSGERALVGLIEQAKGSHHTEKFLKFQSTLRSSNFSLHYTETIQTFPKLRHLRKERNVCFISNTHFLRKRHNEIISLCV